ncbi:MAG TPA: Gfo/Idh/MocA family oxidoreductase [Candidatus Limnocylindria bacterium]|nr:Gfo/Idh/MocA family oxidoreductase [Candidatus Limnocylindria bacterium]
MPDLRLAIVGAGWAGERQAQAARELDGAIEIVCLVDPDIGHVRERAAELGVARTAPALEDVLGDPNIDAVSICTPHRLHAQMAIAAARAGKHVLVEKPMATTVAEATEMIEAARAAGVQLYVAENQVYEPLPQRLRQIVRSGEHIGELTFAALVSGYRAPDPRYAGRREWLTRPELGGTGTWMLQGVHAVAQLRYVLGEVATVYIREHRAASFARPDLEATMSGVVELESGVVVWLVQTTETDLPPPLRGFQLHGDQGSVIGHQEGYEVYRRDVQGDGRAILHAYPPQALSSYALELRAFVDQVRGWGAGPTTGDSERRSLAVVQAGLESALSGTPVNLGVRFPELARRA